MIKLRIIKTYNVPLPSYGATSLSAVLSNKLTSLQIQLQVNTPHTNDTTNAHLNG